MEEAPRGAARRRGRVGRVGHEHVELRDGTVARALVEVLADVMHLVEIVKIEGNQVT